MTRLLALLLWAALLPLATWAAETPADAGEAPLIAPPVIEQREFAFHLAAALGVPVPESEDPLRAIRMLVPLGIMPRGGWSPEEAVTPDALAELRDAVATAAAAGRLRLDPPDALNAFERVLAQLELPLPAEPSRRAPRDTATREAGACPDPRVYGDYYNGAGVPPYTYCPPPPAYYPMYVWVPTPFYWQGYFFTGFYALRYPYVIVHPRVPVRPPRFSEGVLGGRPTAPVPTPPAGAGSGFRDTPITEGVRPIPRAVPLPRGREPRFSEGLLGGERAGPRLVPSVPPAGSTGVAPAPRPSIGARPGPSVPPPAAVPPAPPPPAPAPAPQPGGDRGWRDVLGK